MKTTNNVRKTNLKAITTGIVLAVLGFSVNAQGALKPNFESNLKNQMAFAGVLKAETNAFPKSTTGTEASLAAFLVVETEEPMHVEAWMTKTENFEAAPVVFETVSDEKLTIEGWMMDTKIFEEKDTVVANSPDDVKKLFFEVSTTKYMIRAIAKEPALKLEAWMYKNNNWK
jgi:hypothetical protein